MYCFEKCVNFSVSNRLWVPGLEGETRLGNDRLIVKKLTFKRNGAVFGPHNLRVLSDNLICPTYSQSLIDVRSVHMSVFLCPTQRKHCE